MVPEGKGGGFKTALQANSRANLGVGGGGGGGGNVPVMDFCMTGDKHHTLSYVIEILALFHRVVFGYQAADLQGLGIQKVRNSKTGF